MPLLLPLLLPIFSLSFSANVLVISGISGSHLYFMAEVADQLAGFDYNVTILTYYSDPRKDFKQSRFHFVTFADDADKEGRNFFRRSEEALFEAIKLPAEDGMVNYMKKMEDLILLHNRIGVTYFTGPRFSRLLEEGRFDLIVLEQHEVLAAAVKLISINIPVLGVQAHVELKNIRSHYNLPGLIHSEISVMNTVNGEPPTIWDRWNTIVRYFRLYKVLIPLVADLYSLEMQKTGYTIGDYLDGVFDIVFINDHPAFSFPSLTPPNTFFLGPFHLQTRTVNPPPPLISNFFKSCPYSHVIYVSFGSYIENMTLLPWTKHLFRTLADVKVCVIIKTKSVIAEEYGWDSSVVLQQNWIPQQDLLASGRIHYFISHCGNNGRIESIFYNVPLLCIPLFADQHANARLVENNNFGVMLVKEQVGPDTLANAIRQMEERKEEFKENMKRAVDIAVRDPGSGVEALRFYSELLIKQGNADYLMNKIVPKQSFVEMHDLDFVVLGLFTVVMLVSFILVSTYKLYLWIFEQFLSKSTTQSQREGNLDRPKTD